jgi:Transglutaminase-like superfamily
VSYLVLKSWLLLSFVGLVMRFDGLKALHRLVRKRRVSSEASSHPSQCNELLCHAVDLACVFYFKKVLCLQRSAATVLLLRKHGWNAELVIGAQLLPFKSHAWVEINGKVVNDKPYTADMYQVLERC